MTLFSATRLVNQPPPLATIQATLPPVITAQGDASDGKTSVAGVANEVPTDSFAAGISSIIGLSAIQKVVGLLRTVIFLRLLTDDQMGRWSLVALFLAWAAPLVVLGLPGTFGKYVEYFRQRGQLRAFLRRTTGICLVLSSTAVVAMMAAPHLLPESSYFTSIQNQWYGFVLYPVQFVLTSLERLGPSVLPVALVLASTIVWNYLVELLMALRMVRATSLLQFVNAISFTSFGAAFVLLGYKTELSIVVAFGIANVLSLAGALWVLIPAFRKLTGPDLPMDNVEVRAKLLPFAAWVWLSNFLSNTFMASSPFMIEALVQQDALSVDKLVGQFSSSRAIPMIFVTVAIGIGTTVLPYLSHDWELDRKHDVSRRVNLTLKMLALAFSLASAGVLLGSPILFTYILGGRYDAGLSLLPLTLTYCVWFSLIAVCQNFLWCVERAWMGCCALFFGLLANVVLCYSLLPSFGLEGSVWAVTGAALITLVLMYSFSSLHGLAIDRGTWIATLLPLAIGCGEKWGAMIVFIGAVVAWRGTSLLNADEKQNVVKVLEAGWKKIAGNRTNASAGA